MPSVRRGLFYVAAIWNVNDVTNLQLVTIIGYSSLAKLIGKPEIVRSQVESIADSQLKPLAVVID